MSENPMETAAEALRAKQVSQGLTVPADWADQVALTEVPVIAWLNAAAEDEELLNRIRIERRDATQRLLRSLAAQAQR